MTIYLYKYDGSPRAVPGQPRGPGPRQRENSMVKADAELMELLQSGARRFEHGSDPVFGVEHRNTGHVRKDGA